MANNNQVYEIVTQSIPDAIDKGVAPLVQSGCRRWRSSARTRNWAFLLCPLESMRSGTGPTGADALRLPGTSYSLPRAVPVTGVENET